MKDSLNLGQIIKEGAASQSKDAVHIAVAPMIAAEKLMPGMRVCIGAENGEAYEYEGNPNYVGIVDPFLSKSVKKGESFWLFLVPGSITSLRHDWTHPAFSPESQKSKRPANTVENAAKNAAENKIICSNGYLTSIESSISWIKNYAAEIKVDYATLMGAASDYIKFGDYFNEGELFEGVWLNEEFWIHYEIITGEKGHGSFFACSC